MRGPSLFWRFKWILVLVALFLTDIGPIPLTASVMLYILLFRPLWFKKFVEHLYIGK